MTKSAFQFIAAMLLVSSVALWLYQQKTSSPIQVALSSEEIDRIKIGDKCMDAADRSVANLTPIIEFQRLELKSRRATTLTNCMHDNGYIENSAWNHYAQPIANNNAMKLHISADEAMQILRQQDMQVFKSLTNQPGFWLKQK